MLIAPRVAALVARSLDAAVSAYAGEAPVGRALVGRVHSMHRRAVNLEFPGERLITIASEALDDAPWTVRIAAEPLELGLVEADAVAELREGLLVVRGAGTVCEITLGAAAIWDTGRSRVLDASAESLAAAAARLDLLLHRHGVGGGALSDDRAATPIARAVSEAVQAGLAALTRAAATADPVGLDRAFARLIGLGPGLTPAGDDVLAGFAYAASASTTPLHAVAGRLDRHLATHPGRTTLLSRITMAEASRGRVRDGIARLTDLAVSTATLDEPDAVAALDAPARRVLRIGHTSGTDVLSGLIAGLRLESELRGSL